MKLIKLKFILVTIHAIVLLFCYSCDYTISYSFKVVNQLDKPIKLRYSSTSTDTIQALSEKVIFENTKYSKSSDEPAKWVTFPFSIFEIYYNGKKIDKDFAKTDYWTFSANKRLGEHILTIDNTMLK